MLIAASVLPSGVLWPEVTVDEDGEMAVAWSDIAESRRDVKP